LAAKLGQHSIRVNCVSTFAVLTDITTKRIHEDAIAQFEVAVSRMGNLKGEVLKPKGIGQAMLYLASDEANFVSRLDLMVDGGGFSVVNPYMLMAHQLFPEN
jgi:NAD(P)-dependent dehydrogenase (short-subunit alcohol dehydrogenase family)